MTNIRELKREIKHNISGCLPRNGTIRIVCPSCNGGSSREKSMAVSHSDRGIGFCCFRANCNARGYLEGGVTFGTSTVTKRVSTTEKLIIESMPEDKMSILPVQDTSVSPMWESKRKMVLYPVLSYWGTELGYVQRYYPALNDWWTGPKAINIPHNPEDSAPFIHFPLLTRKEFCGTLVLVEDWPSAEAVARHVPSCALLGTNLSASEAGHLLRIGVTHLVICLDNDALAKAAIMKRKMGLIFDKITVLFVDKDPKDMNEKELVNLLGGIDALGTV